MCVGCGGTCSPKKPRFTQSAGSADMRVIGTQMGPTHQPSHLVVQGTDTVSYQTLYTGLAPNGEPALMVLPGTFGQHVRAGRA